MAIIQLENINKSFNNSKVLDDISISINKGDIYGFIGLSGAGKSTLIRTINALEKIDSGKIIVDNTDVSSAKPKELAKIRQKIGFVFQNFSLLTNSSVFENISLPMKIAKYSKEKQKSTVEYLLKIVNLEEKIHSYPAQLSGGQKQRVAIARALALSPQILLCDEATSALDPKTTITILDILKDINQKLGITIVIVTHDMNIIRNICTKVALMEKGKIIQLANVADIALGKHSILEYFIKTKNEDDE